jgi:hypothetical protein
VVSGVLLHTVSSGVMIVHIDVSKHIPSHLTIGGHRAMVSYDGQPMTCYAFNESGHLIQNARDDSTH